MECLLQYLDNLDDLYGVAGLLWERVRRALFMLLAATSTVLFVILLYRSVTAPTLKSYA